MVAERSVCLRFKYC